jgi:hypothetical protein
VIGLQVSDGWLDSLASAQPAFLLRRERFELAPVGPATGRSPARAPRSGCGRHTGCRAAGLLVAVLGFVDDHSGVTIAPG